MEYVKSENGLVVIGLHGEYGEDGWIQERLEKMKIPFTGSNSVSSKLAMNKQLSQEIVKSLVSIIPTYKFRYPGDFDQEIAKTKLGKQLKYFIKPNAKGSSVHTFILESLDEVKTALEGLPVDDYLLQPAISGLELSQGVLFDGVKFLNLPCTAIYPKTGFFDYKAKYTIGASEEITPPDLPTEILNKISDTASQIHQTLGLGS